ncbi:hypothetical protein HDU96_005005 [Phlyctochytrium bullatum]|nr:hypothetical protein HDU96_005005 [Phlyctochytrium bullatum]
MEEKFIHNILKWTAKASVASFFVTYEQIKPDDAFGRTMIDNLKLRHIDLPGLTTCPTLESHVSRFQVQGWSNLGGASAVTMRDAYDKHLSQEERDRVAKLEIFDEVEEWRLMGDHYCLSWAWSVPLTEGSTDPSEEQLKMKTWLELITLSG